MDIIQLANNKTKSISPNQTFIVVLLVLLGLLMYNTYEKFSENKQRAVQLQIETKRAESRLANDKMMISLLKAIKNRTANDVNKEGALIIYDKVFKTSRCAILDKVMHTLTVNHVHDSIRQIYLRKYYTTIITNAYSDDKQKLNQYKFMNTRLDDIMLNINPNDIIDEVLRIMFSDRTTLQKRIDIRNFLHSEFNLFYQKAASNLIDLEFVKLSI